MNIPKFLQRILRKKNNNDNEKTKQKCEQFN